MKIIIDDKIPYIKRAFEKVAEVVYLPGSKTTPEVVKDADAIITRTRTICNEALLKDSSVKFIATATIGYDHIDTEYCKQAGIEWTNAPGCNSKSVEQYIASTLFVLAEKKGFQLKDKTIGIVGVGQVGSKVARVCELFGMKVLLNDPPRERAEGPEKFVSLQKIVSEADIITLHVPLNMTGEDATFHLADSMFFNSLERCPIVINSCRGEVMDSLSAETAIERGMVSGMVVDCWEDEPDIDLHLLKLVDLATPHIAGYSKDGKANGTTMSVQAVSRFFNLGIDNWQPSGVDLPENPIIKINGEGLSEEKIIAQAILATYDIRDDDHVFRKNIEKFEQLRGDYPVRREFPAYTIQHKNVNQETVDKLKTLGFNVEG
ncbi:MAG: erythronate-4-phosphate dehydrogenase [Bacteroidetes bacterium GWF2_42_66]|nr:MAG: erythronate-4-phosphate dehydrogenase [Bacteroidetes bacterium GWA2_42_15]OFY02214.1 MAG: erythronate-4-phosphate dehydrogenase [Bacteroidetes bacterium GWE2_42_39]OFY43661.1 MAG: erythronate-4-phosphate dehydrogenase [Bacteroidetes bacterium GWF2_42_66]HBL75296.1 4-phosphoerythronate dehydrogenase PdxB [Prolixibacteraceae bacterium]HCR90427.1 4-phosphoerythronate dehydrogenase PdxB [Prolixibacteraceae bacterium]